MSTSTNNDNSAVRIAQIATSLDWPTTTITTTKDSQGEDKEDKKDDTASTFEVTIQCAGLGYLEYQSGLVAVEKNTFLTATTTSTSPDDDDDENDNDDIEDTSSPEIDLFSLSEHELQDLNYYQVLHLKYRANLTPDDVKKAYRKACLKYHPDKSGRNEEDDPVFLKVKAAFDVLSTQKIAYDSTELPFDETLPDPNPFDFYKEYGPAFDRNLHFDSRLLTTDNNNNNRRRKSRNNKRNSGFNSNSAPPTFGDENTSIEDVHTFYDYWTHFTSWRDFSIQAAKELESSQEGLENAESRFEKRFYQKEIDKRAKKLKQLEQQRITTLVERAMAVDPRLLLERKRQLEEKELRQKQREQELLDKKRQEEEEKLNQIKREQEEKEQKQKEKLQREKEKKQLRKIKQVFRKFITEACASTNKPEHSMEDDVDLICSQFEREQLVSLNQTIRGIIKNSPSEVLSTVSKKAEELRAIEAEKINKDNADAANGSTNKKNTNINKTSKKVPFTKEELSALSKGVKKFPPGGANRWDQIASYVNNVCRPDTPRTKEECIDVFNQNATRPGRNGNATNNKKVPTANSNEVTKQTTTTPQKPAAATTTTTTTTTTTVEANSGDKWSEEQDKQLQQGLAKFPATMDKNERWTNIAKGVQGKTKKQCVQRFKAIRDAIKNKK